MTCTHAGNCVAWVFAAALIAASTAAAQQVGSEPLRQDPPERPTRAVFDGARRPDRDILTLTTELYGGYDQALRGGLEDGSIDLVRSGGFTGVDAGLAFAPLANNTVDFNARAFGSLRYYNDGSGLVPATSTGDVATSVRLGRRGVVQARGGFTYTPYFDFPAVAELPFSLDALAPVPVRVRDIAVSTRQVGTYDGATDVSWSLTDRARIGAALGIRRTELFEQSRAAVDTTASGQYDYRFDRQTSTKVSYTHRSGEYEAAGLFRPVRTDDFEVSLERNLARSPTRRTIVSIGAGPSLVERDGERLVRPTAGASLTHTFGRSWDVRAAYRRGVTFLDGTPAPVLSDSLTLNFGGLLTRRLEMAVAAAAILGDARVEGVLADYDTYFGSARMRYGLTSRLAIHVEYVYQSQHSFGPTGTAPGQERGGVRAGLSWYVPLLQDSGGLERPGTRGPR